MPSEPAPWMTIHLHREAPPKPALGAPCNGCGACCAVAPCPIGMLISRRRNGRCEALEWQDEAGRYVCGMVAQPQRYSPLRSALAVAGVKALARRFISAGSGCDADLEMPTPSA